MDTQPKMTTPKPTGPLPIIRDMDELLRQAKQAFIDTQREMARTARQRIDGDARKGRAVDVAGKSRTESP